MTAVTTTNRRDTDNLNLRMPAGLRDRVLHAAAAVGDVSQNAFINASIFFSTLAFGELPSVGHPQNILFLADEIERAIKDGDDAIGAFSIVDWADVEPFLKMLSALDYVTDLKVRRDTKASDTIVFAFQVSKTGVSCWPVVHKGLQLAVDRLNEEAKGARFDLRL
jgi:hypothetical protein